MPDSPVSPGRDGFRLGACAAWCRLVPGHSLPNPLTSGAFAGRWPILAMEPGRRWPADSPRQGVLDRDCRSGRSADHADQGVGGPGSTFTTRRSPLGASRRQSRARCLTGVVRGASCRPGVLLRGRPVGQPQSERAMPNDQLGQPPGTASMGRSTTAREVQPRERLPVAAPGSARQAVRCGTLAARGGDGWRGRRFSPAKSGSMHIFVTASRALLVCSVHMPASASFISAQHLMP